MICEPLLPSWHPSNLVRILQLDALGRSSPGIFVFHFFHPPKKNADPTSLRRSFRRTPPSGRGVGGRRGWKEFWGKNWEKTTRLLVRCKGCRLVVFGRWCTSIGVLSKLIYIYIFLNKKRTNFSRLDEKGWMDGLGIVNILSKWIEECVIQGQMHWNLLTMMQRSYLIVFFSQSPVRQYIYIYIYYVYIRICYNI